MKFSILVPVYNVEPYLKKCLDSIVCQVYSDYEVIIVDDGSTDNSGNICDEYAMSYSNVHVIHKENQGLISARRLGIQQATGDFCVFVDSDDYVSKNLLSSLHEFISQKKVDMVIYSFTYFTGDTIGITRKAITNNGYIWKNKRKDELYELLSTSSVLDALFIKAIKTKILKEDPIDYQKYYFKNMSEDTLQSIYPFTAARSIGYLDKSLYYYRYNPQSISRNFDSKTFEKKNTLHVYEMIMEYLPIWGIDSEKMRNRVNARWFNEMMYTFFRSFELAKNKKERKQVISFNWDSMLPRVDIDFYSKYTNNAYLKVYLLWKNNKYNRIVLYFAIRNIYKFAKMKKGSYLF